MSYLYILHKQRGSRNPEIHYVTTDYDDMIVELYRIHKLGDNSMNVFRVELNKSYRKDDYPYSMSSVQLSNASKMNITNKIDIQEEYKRVCRDRKIDNVLSFNIS